jgi:hypothetical protein
MTEYEVLKQVIETDVPAPSSLLPGYPADLEQVVLRALARDRDQRYPTALAFHQDLERFARSRGVVGSALALAEFLSPVLEEAERQVEERMQRRMAAGDELAEPGATPPPGKLSRKPVAADAPLQTLLTAQREAVAPPPSSRLPADFPPELADRLDRMFARACAKDPARRFPSARAMQDALTAD